MYLLMGFTLTPKDMLHFLIVLALTIYLKYAQVLALATIASASYRVTQS